MFQKTNNNAKNVANEPSNGQINKYKLISGTLHDHFGFKLLIDVKIENADKIYCIHCTNRLLTMAHVTVLPSLKKAPATVSKDPN